jgi:hypothetical protein
VSGQAGLAGTFWLGAALSVAAGLAMLGRFAAPR